MLDLGAWNGRGVFWWSRASSCMLTIVSTTGWGDRKFLFTWSANSGDDVDLGDISADMTQNSKENQGPSSAKDYWGYIGVASCWSEVRLERPFAGLVKWRRSAHKLHKCRRSAHNLHKWSIAREGHSKQAELTQGRLARWLSLKMSPATSTLALMFIWQNPGLPQVLTNVPSHCPGSMSCRMGSSGRPRGCSVALHS